MFRISLTIEAGLQRAFSGLARTTAARPLLLSLSTMVVLVALGFGVFNVEVETDVLKLWVDDSTSLVNVRSFLHMPLDTCDVVVRKNKASNP